MTDKSKELVSTIKLVNDKLHFMGEIENNVPVSIDYIPPFGDNSGYTSLELFLLSLTSCVGSAVLLFLRKMGKKITSCEIKARGVRHQEHPTGFSTIFIDINIGSSDVTEADIKKVLEMAEEKYCPVWAMVKGNVKVETSYKVS
jgi:putative redox protein